MSDAEEFKLNGEFAIELKNLLKVCGWCASGGAAKMAIDEGRVSVDGQTETRKAFKVKPGQTVSFDGRTVKVTE